MLAMRRSPYVGNSFRCVSSPAWHFIYYKTIMPEEKHPLLYIGLSEENFNQLRNGETILIAADELKLNRDLKIYYIKTKTERAKKLTPIVILSNTVMTDNT